jgi:hypothetical protein
MTVLREAVKAANPWQQGENDFFHVSIFGYDSITLPGQANRYLPRTKLDEFQPASARPEIIRNKHNKEYALFCCCVKNPQYPTQ